MTGNKIDVFVDESGVDRLSGQSVYCLTFCVQEKRQEIDAAVREIEEKLKIPPFHWREQAWPIKIKFLNEILVIPDWSSILCFADNKLHSSNDLQLFLIKSLAGLEINNLYLDGWKSRNYEQSFKKTLKDLGLKVSRLKTVRFSASGGIRISDAFAGLARLAVESKLDEEVDKIYNKLVKKKTTTQIMSGHFSVRPPHGR